MLASTYLYVRVVGHDIKILVVLRHWANSMREAYLVSNRLPHWREAARTPDLYPAKTGCTGSRRVLLPRRRLSVQREIVRIQKYYYRYQSACRDAKQNDTIRLESRTSPLDHLWRGQTSPPDAPCLPAAGVPAPSCCVALNVFVFVSYHELLLLLLQKTAATAAIIYLFVSRQTSSYTQGCSNPPTYSNTVVNTLSILSPCT